MVEVFKTNVKYQSQAQGLLTLLRQYFPKSRANFDLDDCDKILRIQGDEFCPVKIAELLKTNGFECYILD
ncbi:hypothetical protein [Mucilaginibacter jinjuensis]|uniref:Uncharacterized protein n=1 Tax=Mucilaginibacter jinjuensis TaxID=1176721 RepID=A0ABY7T876_9SPHI|nr:hypothetical protein [Mucilaginibacter jinjuensis]WCT12675.1 hypothetical protein PQO05_01860 [Mucilaginibacter jinjuensis]